MDMSERAKVAEVEAGSVGLSADQLKEILSSVIAEARKPVVTEREKAEIEDQQKTRRENAAAFKEQEESKQRRQKYCDHRTRLVTGADTGSAIVANKNGKGEVQFFICQHCFLVTLPEQDGRKGYVDGVLYDTAKFNQFFLEKVNTGGI